MDKRTLLFVIALTATLFLVNMYFEWQNTSSNKQWAEQQKAKKSQKLQQLEADAAQRTAKPSQLPLAEIYSDPEMKNFLTEGVLDDKSLLTVAWSKEAPKEVYARKAGSIEKPRKYNLGYHTDMIGDPLAYQEGTPTPLRIADLPEFGRFDLQVVYLAPSNKEAPYRIALGEYHDGQFEIIQQKIDKLKKELSQEKHFEGPQADGVVLMKSGEQYLPVGIYQHKQNSILYLEDLSELSTSIVKPQLKGQPVGGEKPEQKFYVLENDYQQLVFSSWGGALIEINLPFKSEANQKSVVREIEFDREMVKDHPYNARFPAHAYYTPGKNTHGPFTEHREGALGGYYPLIRRDLIETGNRKSIRINPRYYALNILSEYPEVAELVYEVKYFDDHQIVFEVSQGHRTITKTFTLPKEGQGGPYCIEVSIKVEGESKGLWMSSGVPEVEWISGSPAPALKYRITRNNKPSVEAIDLPKEAITNTSIYPDWTCNSNGFFGVIIDPLTEIGAGYRAQHVSGLNAPSRLTELDQTNEKFKPQDLPGYMVMMPLKNTGGMMNFRIFAGPFSDEILKAVDQYYSDAATGYDPDYIACQSFHGWFSFISEPFAKFLFILMQFFHRLTDSWALSIILLTVALRLMLYPLNAWSTKSMVRMQQIAPEITAIQEKYKKDPKKAQLEIMNLYRDRGVNPVSGCFPLLIQMPFLIGMFDLLKSTFELRGATFIPGWIDNLTAPDVLFSWNTPIFFIGNQFHLLPILLGLVMFLQQRIFSNLPKDSSLWTEQQRQQRAMGTIMSIVFAVMFYNFPSGLNIYWLSSMLLGILQQWWTQKKMMTPQTGALPAAPAKPKKGKQ